MSTARTRPPLPLLLAAAVLVVVAVGALGFAVVELVNLRAHRWVVAVGTTVLMAGYGVFLLAVANGLRRAARWSRGPAVATQLIQLPVAWGFLGGSTTWVTVVLGGLSLLALVCLLLPTSTVALGAGGGLNGPEGQH
ncbi:hypothetical protein [Desertihabitans aurantiacus]|uniref:hypothetical protein n=1 Tax=Desertihabitans aurantiacus TaxID=2282477 RepID=UPI0013004498|nr:hypothetical protein [Desertihabitans aurantiacus]